MTKIRDDINIDLLKERRYALRLTGKFIADKIGVTKQTISNIESGRQHSIAVVKLFDYYLNEYFEEHSNEFSDQFCAYYRWLSDLES
jgi:transcriptional regulator with XRE-family HTH domain